jgi:hypothetical protein
MENGPMQIQFTLNGTSYSLSTEQVETAMAGTNPDPIWDYAVNVGGQWFPPKQAFVTPLGLTNRDVNSRSALGYLKRLGFQTHDRRTDGPLPGSPPMALSTSSSDVATSNARQRALELACELLAGTGASAADALRAAEEFISWLDENQN